MTDAMKLRRNWASLAQTLTAQSNLRSALTPPSAIGALNGGSGSQWDSPETRRRLTQESRCRHAAFIRDIKQRYGIRSRKHHLQLIEEFRVESEKLWPKVRPDLYYYDEETKTSHLRPCMCHA